MKKAVGYIRVSTDKDKQANSLAAQPDTIKRYAYMAGLDLVDIVRDEVSALKVPFFDRESGKAIREMIRAGKVQHVIGAKVDRLFRDAQDGLATADWLLKQGVNLHVIDTGGVINVGDPAGRMMFTMLLAVAEFEPRRISQRTKEALGIMRKAGKKTGKVPYGYIEKDGLLVMDPEQIARRSWIKAQRDKGKTFKNIADSLNEIQVQTKEGGKWHASTIRQILRRADVEL